MCYITGTADPLNLIAGGVRRDPPYLPGIRESGFTL